MTIRTAPYDESPAVDVIYEDNHLLVLDKPALLPTQGAAEGEDSLVLRARAYLKEKYAKPGNVYIGVVSRLDAFVTGVIVLARTSKAAGRLNTQFASREVVKSYLGLVATSPSHADLECTDWLRKDDELRRVVVCGQGDRNAKQARLRYRVAEIEDEFTRLEINLFTGRKHQIRAQLAHRSLPIIGDRKYGSRRRFPKGIALHASRLEIVHPTTKETLVFAAPPPAYWP